MDDEEKKEDNGEKPRGQRIKGSVPGFSEEHLNGSREGFQNAFCIVTVCIDSTVIRVYMHTVTV